MLSHFNMVILQCLYVLWQNNLLVKSMDSIQILCLYIVELAVNKTPHTTVARTLLVQSVLLSTTDQEHIRMVGGGRACNSNGSLYSGTTLNRHPSAVESHDIMDNSESPNHFSIDFSTCTLETPE